MVSRGLHTPGRTGACLALTTRSFSFRFPSSPPARARNFARAERNCDPNAPRGSMSVRGAERGRGRRDLSESFERKTRHFGRETFGDGRRRRLRRDSFRCAPADTNSTREKRSNSIGNRFCRVHSVVYSCGTFRRSGYQPQSRAGQVTVVTVTV